LLIGRQAQPRIEAPLAGIFRLRALFSGVSQFEAITSAQTTSGSRMVLLKMQQRAELEQFRPRRHVAEMKRPRTQSGR
jgi:hypothetical protein